MDCIRCGSGDTEEFFIEVIPCKCCGENIELIYNVCNNCGILWKSVDGEVINNSSDASTEIDNFLKDNFDDAEIYEAFEEMDEIINNNLSDKPPDSMKELMHKCLRCNSVAYEIKPGYYCCSDCGFKWEVFKK